MNNREQFEAYFETTASLKSKDGVYHNRDVELLYAGWKGCAEPKQSELDKANARIAQLEDALKIELEVHDAYLGEEYSAGSQRDLHGKLLKGSSDAWLSEHDKAVELKVLEDVNLKLCNHDDPFNILMDMIESRK